ncbi:MAG: two-component system sensor histidine kinase NtrB [Desulfatiglandales bacterium]
MKGGASSEYFWYLVGLAALLILLLIMSLGLYRMFRLIYRDQSLPKNELIDHGISTLLREIGSLKEQLRIRERLAVLGELSASIIHQIRNPLGVIAGYARLIERHPSAPIPIKDYAQAILDEIGNIDQIMEGLISVSKTETVKRESLELRALILEILRELQGEESQVELHIRDQRLLGDRVLLKQALKNIIQNGLEAGDRLVIRSVASKRPQMCEIEIEDNGPGIPEEERESVFLPFYSKKEGPRGMGLPIAQKIIHYHDGSLEIASSPRGGTIFRIALPKETDGPNTACG